MKLNLLLLAFLLPIIGYSQVHDSLKNNFSDQSKSLIFNLGEITITAKRNLYLNRRVSIKKIDEQNIVEVSRVLNFLPGINITASGPRNESTISLRGFDLRAVPVYMDGIPDYVPYDGYVDLARFTSFDLSAIDVSKGFSSVLFGPNSLGGTINLISRKPADKFEFDGSIGILNNNGHKGNLNIGSKMSKFYFLGGISYLHRNSYTLSSQFISTKNEDGGERDNSYRTDKKITLKLGWLPNEKHEYVLGYINQQGEKGTPVYCGSDTLNSLYKKPRYWQWPAWNKETFYFLSNTAINNKNYIKARMYYDIFKNSLNSYDDATYTTQNKPYAFLSLYNDYSYGGNIEYGTKIFRNHHLTFAVHYKDDVHRENNLGEPVRHFDDYTVTFGMEDVFNVTDKLVIIPGINYSVRKNIKAEDYNSTTKTIFNFPDAAASNAFNGQLGVSYDLNIYHHFGLAISRKTRFATIKDRYSYRMGLAIPNPDLKPETTANFEFNYSASFLNKLNIQAALFYSYINNAILSVSNVQPGKSQMQNTGSAEFEGFEVELKFNVLNNLSINGNYSYIKRNNLTNPTVYFTDVPNSKLTMFVQYKPLNKINIITSAQYNSSRYSTSYGTITPEFTLFNAVVSANVWKYFDVEAGVNNILDKNYSLVEGYPEEGRNYFITLRFFNHY